MIKAAKRIKSARLAIRTIALVPTIWNLNLAQHFYRNTSGRNCAANDRTDSGSVWSGMAILGMISHGQDAMTLHGQDARATSN
jgi:uncharacterized membrane protein